MTLINTGFDLEQTLESGQCFRFAPSDSGGYHVIAGARTAGFAPDGAITNDFWTNYFDLNTDYDAIKSALSEDDPVMTEAISFAPGIRILKQDSWETLICFIISQNNRIPQIKRVVEKLCLMFGDAIDGTDSFAFPTAERLAEADVSDLLKTSAGFRARYIKDAAEKVSSGTIDLSHLDDLPSAQLKQELMGIVGVGEKVADCVMTFGFGRRSSFPVDVWIGRVMRKLYMGGRDASLKEIRLFAEDKWGGLAAYANQYLFHYARMNSIV